MTPLVAGVVTGGDPNVTPGQAAAIAGIATLTGGVFAGLAGQNAMAGANAAQNEAINNCMGHPESCWQWAKKGTSNAFDTFASSMPSQEAAGYAGIRPPDAISVQAGGMQFAGSYSINTQTGQTFAGPMINTNIPNPIGAGWSLNLIWLNALSPTANDINQYLNGFSYGMGGVARPPEGLPVSIGGGFGYSPGAGTGDDGTPFLAVMGQAFSDNRMTQMVRNHVRAAGLGNIGSCHLFRHAMATQMLENGADVRFIQAMLGHADIKTTQVYTGAGIRALKDIHSATHPARLTRVTLRLEDEPPVTVADLLATLDDEASLE